MQNELIIDVMLDEHALMPTKAHDPDAGFDLYIPENTESHKLVVRPGGSTVIDTGVHMAIPHGYTGFLKSKSGLNIKADLNGEGVVDADYIGSIVVKLYNLGHKTHHFKHGDKLIQIVILPIPKVTLNPVTEFKSTERGENGFGSSGR